MAMCLRSLTKSGSLAVMLASTFAAGQSGAAANGPEAFSGIWKIERPVATVSPIGGGDPPLLPEARQTYEARQTARRAGDLSFDPVTWCAGPGIPRLMFMSYPFELLVESKRVAFLYEWNHWARVVDMVSKELEVFYPLSMGVATGHWEGATLVISTVGVSDTTLLDSAGLPHSDDLKLTERLRLLNRDRLENRITIEDARTFSRPWEVVVTYRRQPAGTTIKEDVCLDRIKQGEPAVR